MKKKALSHTQLLVVSFVMLCSFSPLLAQNEKENNKRFFDSAEVYVITDPIKGNHFLDSIPLPLSKSIKGEIDRYYSLRARIHNSRNETTEAYQNWLLALKYAEESNDKNFAAYAATRTFVFLTEHGREEEATEFLGIAKKYYEQQGDFYGLMDVKQIPAYLKFEDEKWQDCISLLEENLDEFKNLEQQYLYAYAVHMMAISHLNLGNYIDGKAYTTLYNTLNDARVTVDPFYKAQQQFHLAKYFLDNDLNDSTLFYIKEIYKLKPSMDDPFKLKLYGLASTAYGAIGEEEIMQIYSDSLTNLEKEIKEASLASGLKLSKDLVKTQDELDFTAKKEKRNLILALCILALSLILGFLFFKNFQKVKQKVSNFKNKLSELSYLKHNQDKLTAKVHGLEEYIRDLKNEVKNISSLNDVSEQRQRIKALYKNIHLDSSNVLSKGDSHLEIINDLNLEFFKSLSDKYPSLNPSEQMICYYLHMGFKNKEIAFFLNTSIRSVESKRYRLTKKMSINTHQTSLSEFLSTLVKES